MDQRVLLLTDVTVLQLSALGFGLEALGLGLWALGAGLWGVGVVDVSRIEPLCDRDGREHVRRMKHRLATQTADASLLEHALIALDPHRLALPIDDLRHAPAFNAVGA